MINGDINKFKNDLYYGDEFELEHNNKQYFVQSYFDNSNHGIEFSQWNPYINKVLYKIKSMDINDNIEKFLNEKLFDGKSFYEAEDNIEWLDIGTIIVQDK